MDSLLLLAKAMNISRTQDIDIEFFTIVTSMTTGKTPGHNGIPLECVQHLWLAIIIDFHHMILDGIEERNFSWRINQMLDLSNLQGDGTKYLLKENLNAVVHVLHAYSWLVERILPI